MDSSIGFNIDSVRRAGQNESVFKGVKPEVERVAREFTAVLAGELMKSMRATVKTTEGLGGGGFGEEVFRQRLDEEWARNMALKQGGPFDSLVESLARKLNDRTTLADDGAVASEPMETNDASVKVNSTLAAQAYEKQKQ